jgi:hypothetical protein
MPFKTLTLAAAAAAALTAPAVAQQTPGQADTPIGAQTGRPLAAAQAPSAGEAGVPASAVAEVLTPFRDEASPYIADAKTGPTALADPTVVTSPIVPDNDANRALYLPLFNAGRKTQPVGN